MKYEVRALSPDQQLHTLVLDAANEPQARQLAQARGYTALSLTVQRSLPLRARRGEAFSLLLFSQELHSLLEAGLSLTEALEALAEKASGSEAKAVLDGLLRKLQEGLRFSDAVAERPELFPPLYVGTLKAAERTGDLARALSRYIDYQSRLESVRSKVVSACIYPAILLSVGGLVTLFLLGHVVPSFAAVYRDSGREMPVLSRWLMAWGELVGNHTTLVGAAALVLVLAVAWGVRRLQGEGGWIGLFQRIPGIAEQARAVELSRLYLTLGMLLEGGITLLVALEMVSGTVSKATQLRLAAARLSVAHGEPLSQAFEAQQLTTPVALRMLRVGERTGQLGGMLTRAALFHEGESARWIDRFSKTFEPALMALIGLLIGGIVVLLYMPIFDLAGSLQ